eukprot:359258-Chlamydomonas_euryale.AAC.1
MTALFDEDPLQGAQPYRVAFGFVSNICVRAQTQLSSRRESNFRAVANFFTSSHKLALAEEKDMGCLPDDSQVRFRSGPLLTSLNLLPWTMHPAFVSADQHIRPHYVSIYVPDLRIPRLMGHWRVAPSTPCHDSWAGLTQGHLGRCGPLSGAGRHCVVVLRLETFSRLTREDQDIGKSTSCEQFDFVHETPHGL